MHDALNTPKEFKHSPRCKRAAHRGVGLVEVMMALVLATSGSWAVLQARRALDPVGDRSAGLRAATRLAQDELDGLRISGQCVSSERLDPDADSGVHLSKRCLGPSVLLVLAWQDRQGRTRQQPVRSWSLAPPWVDN